MKIKKKGATLLEVIISLVMISVLLVPAAKLVISASKKNKDTEIKQQGKDIGQGILEKISSFETIKEDSEKVVISYMGEEFVIKKTSDKYILEKGLDEQGKEENVDIIKKTNEEGKEYYTFCYKGKTSKNKEDVDLVDVQNMKNYKVSVLVGKNTNFTYRDDSQSSKNQPIPDISKANEEYDGIITLTNDHYFSLTKNTYPLIYKKEWNDEKNLNPLSMILFMGIDENNKIKLDIYENVGTISNPKKGMLPLETVILDDISLLKSGFKDEEKILVNLSDFDKDNEVNPYGLFQTLIVQSEIKIDESDKSKKEVKEIVFDVLKTEETIGDLDIIFDTNDGKYTHQVNYFTPNTSNSRIGDNYTFEVKVELNNKNIFEGKVSKNIIVN